MYICIMSIIKNEIIYKFVLNNLRTRNNFLYTMPEIAL